MQDKKIRTEMALLSVPLELLSEAGIITDGILEMYTDGNCLVIQNADAHGEFVQAIVKAAHVVRIAMMKR